MAVTSQILEQGRRNLVMHFTNDGATDETAGVTKVDVSTLSPPATRVAIKQIKWSVAPGATGGDLRILWDATADDLAWVMPSGSNDTHDFCDIGHLQNPKSAGFTGDVVFDPSAADIAYSVTLWMVKKYD